MKNLLHITDTVLGGAEKVGFTTNKPIYAPFLSIFHHFFRRSSELIRSVLLLHLQNSFAFKCFRAQHQAPTVPAWICCVCVCRCLSAALACQQTHFFTSVRIHHSGRKSSFQCFDTERNPDQTSRDINSESDPRVSLSPSQL